MFRLPVKVTPDGGEPYSVEIDSRDVLAWEEGGKGRKVGNILDPTSLAMSDLYALTYRAVTRLERFGGDITDFKRQCIIEMAADDDDGDLNGSGPTR